MQRRPEKTNVARKRKGPTPAVEPTIYKRRRGARPLGPFAYLVMQHIRELLKQGPDEAYGLNICESMTNDLRAIVDLAQIYVVLKRLGDEGRGFLKSRKVPAPSGSGHTVTAYTITPEGEAAMEQAARFYDRLYRGGPHANGDDTTPRIQRRGRS